MWIGLFAPFIYWFVRWDAAIYGRLTSREKRWLWRGEQALCMNQNSVVVAPKIGYPTSGLIKNNRPISGFSSHFTVCFRGGFSTITRGFPQLRVTYPQKLRKTAVFPLDK